MGAGAHPVARAAVALLVDVEPVLRPGRKAGDLHLHQHLAAALGEGDRAGHLAVLGRLQLGGCLRTGLPQSNSGSRQSGRHRERNHALLHFVAPPPKKRPKPGRRISTLPCSLLLCCCLRGCGGTAAVKKNARSPGGESLPYPPRYFLAAAVFGAAAAAFGSCIFLYFSAVRSWYFVSSSASFLAASAAFAAFAA